MIKLMCDKCGKKYEEFLMHKELDDYGLTIWVCEECVIREDEKEDKNEN
jgi:hypothetical protein